MKAMYEEKLDVLVPDWYEDFHCIGGACDFNCCEGGWNITIDKRTYEKYAAIKDEEFQRMLADGSYLTGTKDKQAYAKFKYNETKDDVYGKRQKCYFQTPEGLCYIQKNFGEEYLCKTCATYPRSSIAGIGKHHNEASITLSCFEAARLAVLSPDPIAFKDIQISTDPKKNVLFRYMKNIIRANPGGIEDAEILLVRQNLIDMVYDRSVSLPNRLMAIVMFVKHLSENIGGKDYNAVYEAQKQQLNISVFDGFLEGLTPNPAMQNKMKAAVARTVYDAANRHNIRQDFFEKIKQDWIADYVSRAEQGAMNPDVNVIEEVCGKVAVYERGYWDDFVNERERALENFLAYAIFSRVFPFYAVESDKGKLVWDFEKALMELTASYSMLKFMLCASVSIEGCITDKAILDAVTNVSRAFFHNEATSKRMLDAYKADGIYGAPYIAFMLK